MITGELFLEYAKKLAARGNTTEAEQRSAISRAYYGAYHVARALLQDLGIDRADHQVVKYCLCNSGNAQAEFAGDLLGDLGTARRRADDEIKKALDRQGGDPAAYVRKWVEAAVTIVDLLDRLPPLDPTLKAAIEKYLLARQQSHGGPSHLN